MIYEEFLTLKGKDFKGRTLDDIWSFSDKEIEENHDFIQIIFPLNKPSQSVFHGYYLDSQDLVKQIKNNKEATNNIIKSSKWFISFLERNKYCQSAKPVCVHPLCRLRSDNDGTDQLGTCFRRRDRC